MKLLITGSTGLLGANLTLAASLRKFEVTAALHRIEVHFPSSKHIVLPLDSEREVARAISLVRPDWIIHCAAYTNVDWCEAHPREARLLHVDATEWIAKAAAQIGSKLLYVSTDSVFDGQNGDYKELDSTNPLNVYAKTKLEGETVATKNSVAGPLIVRINLFGWNLQPKSSLAEWILTRLESGESIPGFNDVYFSPLLATDISDILLDLISQQAKGVFHLGAADKCSKYDFALSIAKTFGFPSEKIIPTTVQSAKFIAARPFNSSLNSGKLAKELKLQPPYILDSIFRFKQQRDQGYNTRLKSYIRNCHG